MKKYVKIAIAFLSALLCSLLVFTSVESKVADSFQRALPSLTESRNVVMLSVDDAAIENIGTWPFSRDVYAESMITLKELGARSVVFDLSFLDKSPAKVDERYVTETLPEYVDENITGLSESVKTVLRRTVNKEVSPRIAGQMIEDLSEETKNKLDTSISYVIRSQDALLANGLTFFGST